MVVVLLSKPGIVAGGVAIVAISIDRQLRRIGERGGVADRLVGGDVLDRLNRADLVIDQEQRALVGLEMR
jgi:hypothetical protein